MLRVQESQNQSGFLNFMGIKETGRSVVMICWCVCVCYLQDISATLSPKTSNYWAKSAGVEKLFTGNLPPLLCVRTLVSLHASLRRSESRHSVVSVTLAVVQ